MFICIAKELNQLYDLYDNHMNYSQLLVNLAKPMCFMSEVDYFWRQVSPENVWGQLNKKNCEIRWNWNWKWAWLQSVTNLFVHGFHKKNVSGKETELNYIQPQTYKTM